MRNYELLPNGLIKQREIVNKKQSYDLSYINSRYNSYGEKGMQMAYLRLGFLLAHCKPDKLLDVGYGNGDFLKAAKEVISECYGNDVSNYPLPDKVEFVENILSDNYDVVCFFDSLEHFDDISFVRKLKTTYIYISVPNCHFTSEEWFMSWKHRRPDEHLWHFSEQSLQRFMADSGFYPVCISDVEDCIRKPFGNLSNILTGLFKKKK